MKKLLVLLCMTNALSFTSLTNTLQQLTPEFLIDSPNIEQELRAPYFKAFKAIYEVHWSENLENMIVKNFDTYIGKFKNGEDILFIVARMDETIVGWSLFTLQRDNKQAVLELICIDPYYWRQGWGKKLVYGIKEYAPEIKKVSLISLKINTISPQFYTSIGFKKTDFKLTQYENWDVQGFELELSDVSCIPCS